MAIKPIEFNNERPLHDVVEELMFEFKHRNPRTNATRMAIPYIMGAPGGGKTEKLRHVAETNGWGYKFTHISLKAVEELTGLPQFEEVEVAGKLYTGTKWSLPDEITDLYKLSQKYKNSGVLWILDDFHLAGRDQLNICFELFTEYNLKGYAIPENVHIILSGNPGPMAGAKSSLSAVVNRIAYYPVKTDFKQWKAWAVGNDVHPSVISFLSADNNARYFHEEESNKQPWASPREWTYFSESLKLAQMRSYPNEPNQYDIGYLAAGRVGNDAAGEFTRYHMLYQKVNTPAIFDGKIKLVLPQGLQDQYILCVACAHEYSRRYTNSKASLEYRKSALDTITKLLELAVNDGSPDNCIIIMKEIIDFTHFKFNAKVEKNPEYSKHRNEIYKVFLDPNARLKTINPKAHKDLGNLISAL